MINQESTLSIVRYLNNYVFKTIWNEPMREYRHNIIPKLTHERSCFNSIQVYGFKIDLPEADTKFYVYSLPVELFEGIDIIETDWIQLDTLLNENDMSIRVHGPQGEWLHRNSIYVLRVKHSNVVLFAVKSKMFLKVLPFEQRKNIYIVPYFDSDIVNKMTIDSRQITSAAEANAIVDNRIPNATTTYINGRECHDVTYADIQLGDYVELIFDENVIGTIDIDLALNDPNRVFHSELTDELKQIIHIPKDMNPEQALISHNTCDVFVRPRNHEGDNLKGLFMHRCQGDNSSLTQLTHQDFAIPMYMITNYHDVLDSDEITLHILIRTHSKNNRLVRDKNYIDMLYHCDDDTILDFLESGISNDLDFWQAKHLEQSEFVKMMFDTPNIITPDNIYKYVEALGYYHVISLIGERVKRYSISDTTTRVFKVLTPIVARLTRLKPIIYIAGRKILENQYHVLYGTDAVNITIANEVAMNIGDDLIIEFIEYPDRSCVELIPDDGSLRHINVDIDFDVTKEDLHVVHDFPIGTLVVCHFTTTSTNGMVVVNNVEHPVEDGDFVFKIDNTGYVDISFSNMSYTNNDPVSITLSATVDGKGDTIQVPYSEFDLYELVPSEEPVVGIEKSNETVYKKVLFPETVIESITEHNGEFYIKFKSSTYGRIFQLRHLNYTYENYYELTTDIDTEQPLIIELICRPEGADKPRPVTYLDNFLVYLNGRELVKGIDYEVHTFQEDLYDSFKQIVIQNMSYLKEGVTNVVEVIGLKSEIQFVTSGFTKNTSINHIHNMPFWYDNLSMLQCEGLEIKDLELYQGNLRIPHQNAPNPGLLYSIRTILLKDAKDFVDLYHEDDDSERYVIIRNYFNNYPEEDDVRVIISNSHKLYSLYLQCVIRDLRSGKIRLTTDPETNGVQLQIPQYNYLLDLDVCIGNNLDLRFIDVYPTYQDLPIGEIPNYAAIEQLAKSVLTEDTITDGDYVDPSG